MDITKETRLADLFAAYPWLKDEMTKISDKFKLLNSPLGKVMLKKATISEFFPFTGAPVKTRCLCKMIVI